MKTGFLSLILHAHLPYVRHPEHESFFEENWLFEAITECYIPLIGVLDRLQQDQIQYRLTLSLSPPLLCMLRDELLQQRYHKYLKSRIDLSKKEVIRTQNLAEFKPLAEYYLKFYQNTLAVYQRKLAKVLKHLEKNKNKKDYPCVRAIPRFKANLFRLNNA